MITEVSNFEGAVLENLRDFGGLPIRGGVIRSKVLYRSDDIALTTSTQMDCLIADGLNDIIDLRSVAELNRIGRGFAALTTVRHHHVPLSAYDSSAAALARMLTGITDPESVGKWYAAQFLAYVPSLVHAIEIIAHSSGGVLFHCSFGKDRTGLLAIALLSSLGASKDTIVSDYSASSDRIALVVERLRRLDPVTARDIATYDKHPLMDADPKAAWAFLESAEQHGGIEDILRQGGLSQYVLDKLAAKVTF